MKNIDEFARVIIELTEAGRVREEALKAKNAEVQEELDRMTRRSKHQTKIIDKQNQDIYELKTAE